MLHEAQKGHRDFFGHAESVLADDTDDDNSRYYRVTR